MEERERSPLPRDAFSFAFFLSSLLSLSLFPKTRATQSQRRRPFVCGLLSAFSFFFSKIRESSLTLSRAVARVFKFFHQRSKARRRREEDEIQKKKKKKERRRERARLEKTRLSLSLFWWCLAAQKTPIDASAARASRFRLLLLLLLLLPSLPSRDERDDDDIFFWCAFFLLCCFFDPFFY